MIHPTVDIHTYLKPGVRVHLAGIGGVSMCPLAEVLRGMGLTVQGSDMTESDTVRHLRSLGIPVAIGHSAENLQGLRSGHPHRRHPRRQPGDRRAPSRRGIPVYERAQAWGAIMQHYRKRPVRLRHPRQDHHHLHVPPISSWRPRPTPR